MAQQNSTPYYRGPLPLNGDEFIAIHGRTLTTRMLRLLEVRSTESHMPNRSKHPDRYRLHVATNWAIDILLNASCQTLKIRELWEILDRVLDDTKDKKRVIAFTIFELRRLIRREEKLAARQDEKRAAYLQRQQQLTPLR